MEKKAIQPETIQIKEFRLVSGLISSPFEFDAANIKSFDFKVDFKTAFNFDANLIKADFKVNVSTISEQPVLEEAVGKYYFIFIFHLGSLADHAKVTAGGEVDMNPYLANAIASISYSTSRGILLSRFQGTVMQDFLLPVIDPNTLFQDSPPPTNPLK